MGGGARGQREREGGERRQIGRPPAGRTTHTCSRQESQYRTSKQDLPGREGPPTLTPPESLRARGSGGGRGGERERLLLGRMGAGCYSEYTRVPRIKVLTAVLYVS